MHFFAIFFKKKFGGKEIMPIFAPTNKNGGFV